MSHNLTEDYDSPYSDIPDNYDNSLEERDYWCSLMWEQWNIENKSYAELEKLNIKDLKLYDDNEIIGEYEDFGEYFRDILFEKQKEEQIINNLLNEGAK